MKTLLTGVLALACSTSVFAQDIRWGLEGPGELPTSLSAEPQPAAGKDWALAILLEVLLPPDGDVASGVEWKDAFGEGIGLRIEFDRLWGLGAGDLKLGIYGGVGATLFGGEDVDLGGGTILEIDPLMQAIVVVGAKLAYRPPDGVQLEARLGIGMVNYFATEGEIGVFSGDIIDSSQEFFYELGGRIGFVAGSIILEIGLQVRSQAEPEPADPATIDFEDALLIYGLDAGIMIRF
jgi:hypothetical protein